MEGDLSPLHSNSCDVDSSGIVKDSMLNVKSERLESDNSISERGEEMLMVDPSVVSGTVDHVDVDSKESKIVPVNLILADGTVVSQLRLDTPESGNIDLQALQNLVTTRILMNLQQQQQQEQQTNDAVNRDREVLQLQTTQDASDTHLQLNNQQQPQILMSSDGQLYTTGLTNNSEPSLVTAVSHQTELSKKSREKTVDKSPKKHRGGWPKGKKRKPEKISNAPKPPASAYCLYTIERRPKIREENSSLTFAEQVRLMGHEWSYTLLEDEKQKYFDLAAQDKKRYMAELKEYQNNDRLRESLTNKNKDTGGHNGTSMDDYFLHCKVCDMYFTNYHNKTEHMLGAKHLNSITKVVEADMQERNRKDKEAEQLTSNNSTSDRSGHDKPCVEENAKEIIHVQLCSPPQSEPLDVSGFMLNFMHRHHEREQELQHLKISVQESQHSNSALLEKYHEHKAVQEVLDQDLATLRTYGAALSAQIDALRMVPALFGVGFNGSSSDQIPSCDINSSDTVISYI